MAAWTSRPRAIDTTRAVIASGRLESALIKMAGKVTIAATGIKDTYFFPISNLRNIFPYRFIDDRKQITVATDRTLVIPAVFEYFIVVSAH
jgi:hypothetical protein